MENVSIEENKMMMWYDQYLIIVLFFYMMNVMCLIFNEFPEMLRMFWLWKQSLNEEKDFSKISSLK
jgi:hypothetical protein